MKPIWIVSAKRTPQGRFLGALSKQSAVDLGVAAAKAAMGGFDLAAIDSVIVGNVLGAGLGMNVARQIGVGAGLPLETPAFTVNMMCASGMQAVILAAQAIAAGSARMVLCGGTESMSNAQYVLSRARGGYKLGDGVLIDSILRDGLSDAFSNEHMGLTAERVASRCNISRADQDAFAARSQQRYGAAVAAGRFRDEIVAVDGLEADEHPRPETTAAKLGTLRPAFDAAGTVTAGNASGINDGAAMLVVCDEERGREAGLSPLMIVSRFASVGCDPAVMGLGPVYATQRVSADVGEFDMVELNEAFAAQSLACVRELGLDEEKVNPDGGAIALGHPIGASGARFARASGASAAEARIGNALRRWRDGVRGGAGAALKMSGDDDDKLVGPGGVWTPSAEFVSTTNIAWLMRQARVGNYADLHRWSVENREAFWAAAIERVGIQFRERYGRIVDMDLGVTAARWLVDARLNIVESCFLAPTDSPAIVHQREGGEIRTTSVGELAALTDRVAANLHRRGYVAGTALAILMPMTAEAVAIYLGIIKAGCVAVGIADSFGPKEIASRLRLSKAAAVFTQDVILRGGKELPLYSKVVEAATARAIVVASEGVRTALRAGDELWPAFLENADRTEAVVRGPEDPVNILFSSGTTGEPKLIPWTQTTPIKCAVDAHFHQNVQAGDVLVWPTNMGWMMGPWLVFASLINRATMGLYDGAPTGHGFGMFVEKARATMLGVVPSLVKSWRHSGCMEGLDWISIKLFSSTGECSNADDMAWLMELAGGKPVIEYCGGTEIGGGYLTGTVALPCVAGTFNTPALGLDVAILDEDGRAADSGELFIVPPSIGLSNTLLNKSHEEVYFAGVPRGPKGEVLRRHGDQVERLPDGRWRALGRADDTMNLGGIKVSSAEIESVVQSVPGVVEAAAIAVSPEGGPSLLVIFATCRAGTDGRQESLMAAMQTAIRRDLNPLFKIHDLVVIDALPRTASNKVMRRALRDRYLSK